MYPSVFVFSCTFLNDDLDDRNAGKVVLAGLLTARHTFENKKTKRRWAIL